MGLQNAQQLHVVFIGHLMPILFLHVPGGSQVGRITVNQHVGEIESPDQLHRRGVFNLYAAQSFCGLQNSVRHLHPRLGSVGPFSALDIVLPSNLLTRGAKAMALHHTSAKVSCPT